MANGRITKSMAKEFIISQMEINMTVSGKMTKSMAKEFINSQMEINMMDIF